MASKVVFVKVPSIQQKRRGWRSELNDERNTSKIETVDELESFRVRYNADPEQKRASARDGTGN